MTRLASAASVTHLRCESNPRWYAARSLTFTSESSSMFTNVASAPAVLKTSELVVHVFQSAQLVSKEMPSLFHGHASAFFAAATIAGSLPAAARPFAGGPASTLADALAAG